MLTVPSQPHRRLPRVLVAILCVGMLGAVLSPSPASAQDDVQSLRDRASALADRLQELEREAAIADEDYLGTLDELEKLYTEINSTEVSIEEAQGRVESAEAQASEFLVVAATLLDLKVAGLLPQGELVDAEDVALLEARDLLFARLLQYRAFKLASAWLSERLDVETARHWRAVCRTPSFRCA